MYSYFDTKNWTLFRYLSYCKEKGVLEIQAIEHYNYLQFFKLLENIPEKKIQVGNAIKISLYLFKYQIVILFSIIFVLSQVYNNSSCIFFD